MSTHYSLAQKPDLLKNRAGAMAKEIERLLEGTNAVPVLCYRGMSGVAVATALSLAMEGPFEMIYVRKEHEKSHGSRVEVSWGWCEWPHNTPGILVFVDDFIATGETRGVVVIEARKNFRAGDLHPTAMINALARSEEHGKCDVSLTELPHF